MAGGDGVGEDQVGMVSTFRDGQRCYSVRCTYMHYRTEAGKMICVHGPFWQVGDEPGTGWHTASDNYVPAEALANDVHKAVATLEWCRSRDRDGDYSVAALEYEAKLNTGRLLEYACREWCEMPRRPQAQAQPRRHHQRGRLRRALRSFLWGEKRQGRRT